MAELQDILSRMAVQQDQVAELLKHLKDPAPVQVDLRPPAIADGVIRAGKVQKLSYNVIRSNRLKIFKLSAEADIKWFLRKFNEELNTMKGVVGLNDELSKEEFVPIFRSCLDFPVVERVDQALLKLQKTWENITIPELKKLMLEKFGSQQTDVANVIKQFGAQRLVKSPDETVAQHYFRWYQNIPEVMKPSDEDGRKEFVDLMLRSMYIISLEDDYLEKELSNLKDPNPDLKKYFDEACSAESRRQSYQDISKSSTCTESKGVNISKLYHKKNWVDKSDIKTDSPSVRPKTDNNTNGDNAKWKHKGQKHRKFKDKNK